MRGISPVIATVLLIAVAVSAGMLVTTWITQWVVTQTTSEAQTCSINTQYVIDTVVFNESGNNLLKIKITNKGSQPLYGFSVELDNGTPPIVTFPVDEVDQGGVTESNPLKREQSVYIIVNLSNSTLGYPTLGATLKSVKVLNDACNAISRTYVLGG